MLSQWGRPTTTGQTDNKRSNTNASEGIVRELIPKNKKTKAKTASLLWQLFFNHWVMADRPKLLMQIQLQTALKLHVLIQIALKTLYPNLSLKLHKCLYQNLLKHKGTVPIWNQKFGYNRWQNNRWQAFFHNWMEKTFYLGKWQFLPCQLVL